jgi:S-DNA-T family DNA segregation ATPase FtsK/SpoIIIE
MVKVRRVPSEERRAHHAEEPHNRRFYDMVGLGLFFIGVACLLWLAWPQEALIPRVVHDTLRLLAGSGAWVIPLILLFIGSMFLVGYERMSLSHSAYGSLLLFLTFVTWRHLTVIGAPLPMRSDASALNQVMLAGGYVGGLLGTLSLLLLAKIGSYILLAFMTCAAVVLIADRPFIEVLRQARRPAMAGFSAAKHGAAVVRERRDFAREQRAAQMVEKVLTSTAEEINKLAAPPTRRRGLLSLRRDTSLESEASADSPTAEMGIPESSGQEASKREANAASGDRRPRRTASSKTESPPSNDLAVASAPSEGTAFQLPPLSLLKEAPPASPRRAQQELAEKIKILEQTLDQFGIGANVVEIAHGPTVTRYEIQLAPGIRVSKIVSLADNLAMALAAIDVRVEAPIPGKSAIGVEVPNSQATTVTLRECIEVAEFRSAPSKLTFALGKDVAGTMRYADLTKMPHLLIGGSTNSGKSACLNVLIASIVYRATPDEVKFIMIDPKRVELSLWDGIPHLLHPVVKDVKQAPGIFRAALKEMDRRYELFSRMGTRNLDGYNQRVGEGERLPYIVVVVDELADLMMQAAAEVETSICRLAQLARATGIHLVIATQRPSVDVITGTIKANISSRIAFAVSSQVDSRTILDMNGAERLIGRGDMLFLPIDANKPTRIQGCFITEAETNALVEYLKQQATPNYTMHPVETSGVGFGGDGAERSEEDDLYEAAVKLIVTNGHASTSMLQRRFKIGYTRAARLLDMMEDRGIVGPLDGAKPREILVSRDEIDQMFRGAFDSP